MEFASVMTSVTEGNSGTSVHTVTVNRSGNTSGTAGVAYATSDGTASAGTDYTATNGTDIVLTTGAPVNTEVEGISFGNYDLFTTLRQFPFYKTDGSSDPINITNSKFPFFKADGSASDIGVT